MSTMVVTSEGVRSPQTEFGQALRVAWWGYLQHVDDATATVGHPERDSPICYLLALYARPGPMTISDMGRLFSVSRQAASKIVADLRRRGYVKSTVSETDQREKVLELTPAAFEMVAVRPRAAAKLDKAIRERIGDARTDELQQTLEEVAAVFAGGASLDPTFIYSAPKLW